MDDGRSNHTANQAAPMESLSHREREGPAAAGGGRVRGFSASRKILIPVVDRPTAPGHASTMDKTANARRLRRDQTLAEKAFWALVRNRRLGGYRFLRQVAIDRYFADFVCEAAKVVVELDGPVHDGREEYDARRTETLERFGRRGAVPQRAGVGRPRRGRR